MDHATIVHIILRNSFQTGDKQDVEGEALFYTASFFNHSCMPNAFHIIVRDLIFIRSAVAIPAGSEIFISYVPNSNGESVQERAEHMTHRTVPFVCACALCQFEKENSDMVGKAIELTKSVKAKEKRSRTSVRTKGEVDELLKARQPSTPYLVRNPLLPTSPESSKRSPRQK